MTCSSYDAYGDKMHHNYYKSLEGVINQLYLTDGTKEEMNNLSITEMKHYMVHRISIKYGSYENGVNAYKKWFSDIDDSCIHLGCGHLFKYKLSNGKTSPSYWGLPSYLYNKNIEQTEELTMLAALHHDEIQLDNQVTDRL